MATETKLEGLEQELSTLLDVDHFDPPEDFRSAALISDESAHEEAARDPEAWWAKLARDLDWFTEPEQVLDDSNSPFFKWFADGKLNASYNCLDRHVERWPRRPGRLPLARRGGGGARRHLCRLAA